MRLLLVGPPGSGKGTQAHLLSHRLHLDHIGTGNLLRAAIEEETPAGREAKPYVEQGELVPDDVVNQLVAEYFRCADHLQNFVMDGYPRNRQQAVTFDELTNKLGRTLDAVVELYIDPEVLVRRLSGRRICPNCNAIFHIEDHPPRRPGLCDKCDTALRHRQDDSAETVTKRLAEYHENTHELLQYYREQNKLKQIAANQDIETVYQELVNLSQPTT